jgi:hypothetical protein
MDTDLVHEYLNASIEAFRDRIIKQVLEALLFSDDRVQKICHINVGGLSRKHRAG